MTMGKSKVLLLVLGITSLAVGFLPPVASATTTLGPFCFSNAPFSDVLVFFVDGAALGNQMQGTGRELNTGRAATFTVVLSGGSAIIGYHIFPTQAVAFDQMGGGVLNLSVSPISGPGFCQRTNSAAGCGTGTNITLTAIICPTGSTTTASEVGNPG
jgi:hypothetical protein